MAYGGADCDRHEPVDFGAEAGFGRGEQTSQARCGVRD